MPTNPLEARAGPNVDDDVTSNPLPENGGGKITSAIMPTDEPVPDTLDDDDEDEDIVPRKRGGRTNKAMDEEEEEEPTLDDDLFGEGSDDELKEEAEELAEPKSRTLDDQDLDSGDDEGRADRVASEQPMEEETREAVIEFPEFDRKPLPEPSDGEMYLLKVPKFLAIDPHMFSTASFEPPTNEHHSRKEPPSTFSAFSTAMSTVRWRHSPSKPEELQSNARILRWSDGSLTLQLASDPTQQFEIDGNPLAPPQKNPIKPTPTSLKPGQKEGSGPRETFTYLTVPHEAVGLLRVTHRITAGLSILPSATTTDDALEKLQTSLAAAVSNKGKTSGGAIPLMRIDEDPELAKKKAEVAEREKMRAQKRREAAENRERERGTGPRKAAVRSYGGLSTSMLEDEDRPRPKPKARRRHNDEYSSDEDNGRRRGNFANDDYEVDDFVAGSDEEEEVAEADSDEEEDEDDGIRERERNKSPKRSRKTEDDDEEDAEGEDDDVVASAPKAKRRRAVVSDEEDED